MEGRGVGKGCVVGVPELAAIYILKDCTMSLLKIICDISLVPRLFLLHAACANYFLPLNPHKS